MSYIYRFLKIIWELIISFLKAPFNSATRTSFRYIKIIIIVLLVVIFPIPMFALGILILIGYVINKIHTAY